MSRPGSTKATGRDYTYDKKYQSSPEQKKARASRNRARALMIKKYGKAAVKGNDVDHTDGNPMHTKYSNLTIMSASKNRAKH